MLMTLPQWNKAVTILQVLFFFVAVFVACIFVLRCIQAFNYGQVQRISPQDQELLNSLGIDSYAELLIHSFWVSFIGSMLIQGLILMIPVLRLRKRQFLRKSYLSMVVMLILCFDWLIGIAIWETFTSLYPNSRVISTLTSFIPAGIIIGGLVSKIIINLTSAICGYVALLGLVDKTLYLIKHRIRK